MSCFNFCMREQIGCGFAIVYSRVDNGPIQRVRDSANVQDQQVSLISSCLTGAAGQKKRYEVIASSLNIIFKILHKAFDKALSFPPTSATKYQCNYCKNYTMLTFILCVYEINLSQNLECVNTFFMQYRQTTMM